jgi:hypothetical protein
VNLFKSTDLHKDAVPAGERFAAGLHFHNATSFATDRELRKLADVIGEVTPGQSCAFVTHGAWCNVSLLEHLLAYSGPAAVLLTTWSISADAITRIHAWQQERLITDLHVLFDSGTNDRKPDLHQLATGCFSNLKTTQIHGKLMVVTNDHYNFVVVGSANLTKNPRIETGMVIHNKDVAGFYKNWFMEVYNGL